MLDNNIQIIYASTTGNTELVCSHVVKLLKEKGIEANMQKAEITNIDVIRDNSTFILAASTWEHGVVNPLFNRLLSEIKEEDLSEKKAGFIGLGDFRYEPVEFCGGMEQLKRVWLEKGGEEIFMPLKVNGEPHEVLDTLVKMWVEKFVLTIVSQ